MSFTLLQKVKWPKLSDTIPPVANHPVRTASNSRIKKSRRSGTVKSADVAIPQVRSPHFPLFAALQIPSGIASSHASRVAVLVSRRVFRARAQSSGATGVSYENENPIWPLRTERTQAAYRTGKDRFSPYWERRPLTVCCETLGFMRIASKKSPGDHCRSANEKIEIATRSNIAWTSRRKRYLIEKP